MKYDESFLFKRFARYSEYDKDYVGILFEYGYDAKELYDVLEENGLEHFGNKNLLSTMKNIMHYVSKKLYQADGNVKITILKHFSVLTINELIKLNKYKFSCWVYALYLAECFLALGIPARMIRCLSGLYLDNDCHCVTIAYCAEFDKYVLFDVANDVIFYSYDGIPLSLRELRCYVLNNKRIFYVQSKQGEKNNLIKYWIKNLMIFQCFEIQKYGNELGISYNKKNRSVFLMPKNLVMKKRTLPINKNYPIIITRNEDEFWR